MDTLKDTTMQPATDAVIAEFKRAAEHPAKAPVIVSADAMLGVLIRLERAEKERDALRAKIEEMEKQEPVVEVQWAASIPNSFLDFISTDGYLPKLGDKLYALPGAQGEEK